MYEIEQHILDVGGFKIAYTDTGAKDGKVLFCVHGLLSNGRDYDFLAQVMADQGYRVIAMDLPGRGRSDYFTDQALYSPPSYIPFCLALIAHVTHGAAFDWLGVSLGGMLGMSLHNFEGVQIDRLIIVDIGAEISGAALDHVSALAKAPTVYKTKDEAITFFKKRCAAWGITDQRIWDHLIAHNIAQGADGDYVMHYDAAIGAALPDQNEAVDLWALWEHIKQPFLLIRGGQSVILPAATAEQMQALYTGPRMDMVVFDACGHVPNLMQIDHIETIARWLADSTLSP